MTYLISHVTSLNNIYEWSYKLPRSRKPVRCTGKLLKSKLIILIHFTYFVEGQGLATIYYMAAYKTIHIYYLKKSHDLLNRSCN